MAEIISLYKATSGLNTTVDPERLTFGEDGIVEFAQAVNISIDDRGLASLRTGDTLLQSGEFHSFFCDGGDCFVVQERSGDAAIMQVNPDWSLSGVRSGLSKGRPMGWCQANTMTFYGNGESLGVIENGVSSGWTVDPYNGPADPSLAFLSSVPVPSLLGYDGAGTIAVANGQSLRWNRFPFLFGLFVQRDVIATPTPITMVKSVAGGWFVSDERYVRFYSGPLLHQSTETRVTNTPATGVAIELVDAADLGVEGGGHGVIWSATDGIWFGAADGSAINLTREKIDYPANYRRGACLVHNKQILHTVY